MRGDAVRFHADAPDATWEFELAAGAVIVILASVAAAALFRPTEVTARVAVMAAAVGTFASVTRGARATLAVAALAFLVFTGLLVNRYGELRWDEASGSTCVFETTTWTSRWTGPKLSGPPPATIPTWWCSTSVCPTHNGGEVRLTPMEWRLLEILVRNPGKLISQRHLLHEVWGPRYGTETHYLRQYMAQLRRKFEDDPAHPRYLLTEPGMGYRFRPADEVWTAPFRRC